MANLKSSKKDIKQNRKRREQTLAAKTALKTYVKKVRTAVTEGDADKATANMVNAAKFLDKAVQKGIIHKNQAARRKSRVAKSISKINAG